MTNNPQNQLSNKMDNIATQLEEVEALQSIFGSKWQYDTHTETFNMDITKNVKLFINLPPEYPSHSLPKYELLAPELRAEQRTLLEHDINKLFEKNDGGPLIYEMISLIEEVVKADQTIEPEIKNIDNVEHNEGTNTPVVTITHGPTIVDRKSVFQGHVAVVSDKNEVKSFMDQLMENHKIAQATHNIYAYRIMLPNNVILQDCEDDGEHKASRRLLELLQTLKLENVMVVVSRWYGGIHLGPDRFRHISNAARQVLAEAGFIKT